MTDRTPKVKTATVRRFDELPNAQQAGMLCNDTQFRRFVAIRMHLAPVTSATITNGFAAEFIRRQCGVSSRRDLNTDADAARKFQTLRTDFDAWAGRIQSPR